MTSKTSTIMAVRTVVWEGRANTLRRYLVSWSSKAPVAVQWKGRAHGCLTKRGSVGTSAAMDEVPLGQPRNSKTTIDAHFSALGLALPLYVFGRVVSSSPTWFVIAQ